MNRKLLAFLTLFSIFFSMLSASVFGLPPTYSLNSTSGDCVKCNITHSLKWSDDVGLSGYIFSFDNCTGSYVNDTWTPFIISNSTLPAKDSYVTDASPNSNYGGSIILLSGLLSRYRAYISFDFSWLPDNTNIIDAQFNFYLVEEKCQNATTALNYSLNKTSDNWSEGGIKWNNQPTIYNKFAEWDNLCRGTPYRWETINFTDIIQSQINSGEKNISFVITYDNESEPAGTYLNIRSKEHDNKPYLTVTWGNPSESWSNVSKVLNSTMGCTIRWKVYANDTDNSWNSTEYSYQTTGNIFSCFELDANNVYHLISDVSSSTTCMVVKGNNATLDCQGHLIGGTGSGSGIYIDNYNNTTIKNCRINNFGYGIRLENRTFYSYIENVTSTNNIYTGIWINGGMYNTIVDYTAYGNSHAGIHFCGQIFGSDFNNLTNCTLYNNEYGIYMSYTPKNNTISDCIIRGNSLYGIFTRGKYNLLFNNLLNQTNNVYTEIGFEPNYWNTTRQIGIRIYSAGTEIGGNYWTNPSGTGYSDTCADIDDNGFCDTPLTLDSGNIDYLPLTCTPDWNLTSSKIICYNITHQVYNNTYYDLNQCNASRLWKWEYGAFVKCPTLKKCSVNVCVDSCPDGTCQTVLGETIENCPKDCITGATRVWITLIPLSLVAGTVGLLIHFLRTGGLSGGWTLDQFIKLSIILIILTVISGLLFIAI